jgi:hypothetical protein
VASERIHCGDDAVARPLAAVWPGAVAAAFAHDVGSAQRIEVSQLEQPGELLARVPFPRSDVPVPLEAAEQTLDPPRHPDRAHRIGHRLRLADYAVVLQPLGQRAIGHQSNPHFA